MAEMTCSPETSGSDVMIRVISMAGASRRRETFEKSAADSRVSWSFYDAHTAAAPFLVNDPVEQRRAMHRDLLPAEIGCYSSHVSVWRQFLDSNSSLLIVFEDDVVVDWDFIALLASADFAEMGLHYIKLFDKVPIRRKVIASPFLNRYYHLVQNRNASFGTQAYVLTRSGAARMAEHATVIRRPIDSELERFWIHKIPSLSVVPSPVFERCSVSTIGEARFTTNSSSFYLKFARLRSLYYRSAFSYFSRESLARLF